MKKYIFRNSKVRRGTIIKEVAALTSCWRMEIDGEGFGPRIIEEMVPKFCVFDTAKECIEAIEEEIYVLNLLIKKLNKDSK